MASTEKELYTPTASRAIPTVEEVRELLYDVVDPELGINIVDLGLLYDVRILEESPAHSPAAPRVELDLTLTSAACPLTDVIEMQLHQALDAAVGDFTLNWVWNPPWGIDKITEEGRDQLRAVGFNF